MSGRGGIWGLEQGGSKGHGQIMPEKEGARQEGET